MSDVPNKWIRFPNAPIREAILDISVDPPSEAGLEQLSKFQDAVAADYPQKRERIQFTATVGEQTLQTKQVDGYLFTSSDGKNTVQARFNGFTVNRLKPYDTWSLFRDNGKRLWEHYLEIAQPKKVTRIALRYINRLELPLPVKDFKEYILTVPEIAPDLPQGLQTFFMRLEIPSDAHKAIAIVTETLEPTVNKELLLPFIFDIDVIRQVQLSPDSKEIWDGFEDLHDFKNEIFFGSITDALKELFQ